MARRTLEDTTHRQALVFLLGTGGTLALACGSETLGGSDSNSDMGDSGVGTRSDGGDAGRDRRQSRRRYYTADKDAGSTRASRIWPRSSIIHSFCRSEAVRK